jgi:hypothetical protein
MRPEVRKGVSTLRSRTTKGAVLASMRPSQEFSGAARCAKLVKAIFRSAEADRLFWVRSNWVVASPFGPSQTFTVGGVSMKSSLQVLSRIAGAFALILLAGEVHAQDEEMNRPGFRGGRLV